VADRATALVRLRATPRPKRRIAILMPDYPGAPGRTGYAVGLDVPTSVVALLSDLAAAGYRVDDAPATPRVLLDGLNATAAKPLPASLPLADYMRLIEQLPPEIASRIEAAWGARMLSGSARAHSATSRSRCRPIAAAPRSAVPTITIRNCRRAMRSSPSGSGCGTSPGSARSSTWGLTAPSNGCPARRWR